MNKLILVSLLLTACADDTVLRTLPKCEQVIPEDDASKEDILVIGDSISIGYMPQAALNLTQYELVHNPCNGMTSVNGLSRVDSWIALRPKWKLITFNHGLWDIVPFYNVSTEQYRMALMEEGLKFKEVAEHVIFFTSTYVPPGAENRNNNDIILYNELATQVMDQIGIPVYDLYTESLSVPLVEHLSPTDVHYTEQGYSILGNFVSQSIANEL